MLVTSKLNKLVTLVRKASEPGTIDQLVRDITVRITTQLDTVNKEGPIFPELSKELNKLVKECEVKHNIDRATR